jgi:hypothetical protein
MGGNSTIHLPLHPHPRDDQPTIPFILFFFPTDQEGAPLSKLPPMLEPCQAGRQAGSLPHENPRLPPYASAQANSLPWLFHTPQDASGLTD